MAFERVKKTWKKTKLVARGYFGPSAGEINVIIKRSLQPTGRIAPPNDPSFTSTLEALVERKPKYEFDGKAFLKRATRLAAANAIRAIGCEHRQALQVMKWAREMGEKMYAYELEQAELAPHFLALKKILGIKKATRFLKHTEVSMKYIFKRLDQIYPID